MKKIFEYISEENFRVEIEIIGEIEGNSSYNVEFVFIENGVRENGTNRGYMVEKSGRTSLYHSYEEYICSCRESMI